MTADASEPPELSSLPEEVLIAILEACDATTLLRVMPCCIALHRLAGSEDLWKARLAQLWRDKCDPFHGLRQWWLCELTFRCSKQSQVEVRAVPSPCADTACCRTLRECSWRESYMHATLDAKRTLVSDEELFGHIWSYPAAPSEQPTQPGSPPAAHATELYAAFRPDGMYIDSNGEKAPWDMQAPSRGAPYPPPSVNVARIGPHFIERTTDWGWSLSNIRRGTLTVARSMGTAATEMEETATGGMGAIRDTAADRMAATSLAAAQRRPLRSIRRRVVGCVVFGLPDRPEINGAFCTVDAYDAAHHAYRCRIDEDVDELRLDEAGLPIFGPAREVIWLPAEHIALPKGCRVTLRGLGCSDGVLAKHGGKEGRVVESPVPPYWAVPLPLRNVSALREAIGHGLVTVRLSASDEVRVAPGQCIVAWD